ncbi:LacI family DNA-binding transcriptional regulator [Gracilibacillus salinarum]|uniref:LacI family transcriptional regulator n=1 Tax=Gracilibacillus salinarum TaxID=2932255 RepID=A0ABY4GS79_9BACI|nr:LacI family DNA-binding transcriptional regulator [Gracilibacillus salinarum]UOQ87000.1 LacI family transcriptional regulator [Gracilibacillus salinarum]
MSPTTIREVAKYANVSEATVSRVINKKGYVSQETLKQVEDAIKHLNYKPNEVARMLYKKKSNTIALLIPDITNPFFPELAKAIEEVAKKKGYVVVLCNTKSDPEIEKKYVTELTSKYIDGLIIMNQSCEDTVYQNLPFSTVFLDRVDKNKSSYIAVQNQEGGKLATEHLISLGCKSILHLSGPSNIITAVERAEGYQTAMKQHGLLIETKECKYEADYAYQMSQAIFKDGNRFDAVFAGNDLIAAGVLRAAKEIGINVPNDLQIIGYDDIDLCKYTTPQLTTIQQPIYLMGEKAAELLIEKIEGVYDVRDSNYLLPVTLMARGSTKPLDSI